MMENAQRLPTVRVCVCEYVYIFFILMRNSSTSSSNGGGGGNSKAQ
jgi:hypothetical protein